MTYEDAMRAAEERFSPLKRALGEVPMEVWQTGGMVMCGAVVCTDGSYYLVGPEGEYMVGHFNDPDDTEGTILVDYPDEDYTTFTTLRAEQCAQAIRAHMMANGKGATI